MPSSGRNKIRLARLFVVPGLVCRTRFHGGENANQARLLPASRHDVFYAILFPKVSFADKLDFDARLRRYSLGVLPNPIPERLVELRILRGFSTVRKQSNEPSVA